MTFHIFHINEVYSNADGTVQFIEFTGDADDQDEWAGHTLTATDGISTHTYTFPANLPGEATLHKSVLIATQGFAELGLITPDYIIPNGFLFTGSGSVTFPGMFGGKITYAGLPLDGIKSLNRDGSTGTNSPANFSGETGTVPPNVLFGTDDPDNLTGTSGDDFILATGGDDTLNGLAGNDTLNGGLGADTAVYSGNRASYTVLGTSSGVTVSGAEGNDTLTGIERFQFADQKIAIDLGAGQAAGNTARLIGAAFDAPAIQTHPDYVGIGLGLFDSGQSMLQVSQRVIGVLGNPSDDAFVDSVYQNVVGITPAPADHNFYAGLLMGSGGSMTQAQLLELAANSDVNATNIDLIGLQQTGVEFI